MVYCDLDNYRIEWKAFPPSGSPPKVLGDGKFLIRTTSNSGGSWTTCKTEYSQDNGLTWTRFHRPWKGGISNPTEREIYDLLWNEREIYKKQRAKELSTKRKFLNAKEAEEQGITVQDLIKQRRDKAKLKLELKKVNRSVKQLNHIVRYGPILKELQETVTELREHISSGGDTHFSAATPYERNIKNVIAKLRRVMGKK